MPESKKRRTWNAYVTAKALPGGRGYAAAAAYNDPARDPADDPSCVETHAITGSIAEPRLRPETAGIMAMIAWLAGQAAKESVTSMTVFLETNLHLHEKAVTFEKDGVLIGICVPDAYPDAGKTSHPMAIRKKAALDAIAACRPQPDKMPAEDASAGPDEKFEAFVDLFPDEFMPPDDKAAMKTAYAEGRLCQVKKMSDDIYFRLDDMPADAFDVRQSAYAMLLWRRVEDEIRACMSAAYAALVALTAMYPDETKLAIRAYNAVHSIENDDAAGAWNKLRGIANDPAANTLPGVRECVAEAKNALAPLIPASKKNA